jgi:hypothetical protein
MFAARSISHVMAGKQRLPEGRAFVTPEDIKSGAHDVTGTRIYYKRAEARKRQPMHNKYMLGKVRFPDTGDS